MMRKELSETVADIAGRPVTTIENGLIPKLQAAGLVPGLKGAGEVDASYRVNVLLAALLDRQHGVSPAEAVKKWRALRPVNPENSIAQEYGIRTENAGAALDSILDTLKTWPDRSSPILRARAGADGNIHVAAEFHGDDCLVLAFYNIAGRSKGNLTFGSPLVEDDAGRATRIVRLLHPAFERLAMP